MVVLPLEGVEVDVRRIHPDAAGVQMVEVVCVDHPASPLRVPLDEWRYAAGGEVDPEHGDRWSLTGRVHLMIGAPSEPHRGWYVMVIETRCLVTAGSV